MTESSPPMLAEHPLDHDSPRNWGWYVILRVGEVIRDEWTNVGVLVYNRDEDLIWSCYDSLDRAISRGDAHQHWPTETYLAQYHEAVPTMNAVRSALGRDGHSLSCMQMTEPRGTYLGAGMGESIFRRFCAPIQYQ